MNGIGAQHHTVASTREDIEYGSRLSQVNLLKALKRCRVADRRGVPRAARRVRVRLASGTREEHRRRAGHAVSADRDDEQQRVPESQADCRARTCPRARSAPHLRPAAAGRRRGRGRPSLVAGHAIAGMPQHYATATIAHLVEAANKANETLYRTTLLRLVNG